MTSANDPGSFERSKTMSVTVGDPDEDSSEECNEMLDLHERFKQMAFEEDSFAPTIFVDDKDIILPSTSNTAINSMISNTEDSCAAAALNSVFGNENRFFQPITSGTFVEELVVEKPPKVVNGYLFGQTLGEGSYSKVKEVIETRTLRRRSIKIIKDKRLRKIPNGQKNVEHEIYILKWIRHPNVIQLLDVFRVEEKQKLYLVMEFCSCSLQQLIDNSKEKRLPEFQSHGYFVQLMDGIDYLHKSGIIHKDIKPGNLLLSLDHCLKICDMGVAELLSVQDPLLNDWCTISQGTPKFQAPEIVAGVVLKFRGRPVDVWAAAVTLFNMISGEYPFDGNNLMKLFENITNQPITWPTNVQFSSELHKFFTNVLDKNPEKRWNSTAIRASEWFNSAFEIKLERFVAFHGADCKLLVGGTDSKNQIENGAEDDPMIQWNLADAVEPAGLLKEEEEEEAVEPKDFTYAVEPEDFARQDSKNSVHEKQMQYRRRPNLLQRLVCPWRRRQER